MSSLPTSGAALEVRTIDDDAALAELTPAWSRLCDASPLATPFQRPEWLLSARRHLSGGAPRVFTVWRGGELSALLPLEQNGDELHFIGAGVSDYLDLICEPGLERAAVELLFAELAAARRSFRLLVLDALRATSPLLGCPLPSGFQDGSSDGEPSPVARLPVAIAPGKMDYYRRRLSRLGGVAWRSATPASAAELVSALIALHGARWGARGEPGALADPAVQRFHLEAAPGLARRNVLRMHALELDGQACAVFYGFVQHGRCHFYLSGFDPELGRYSPGAVLLDHAIRHATAEGALEFDFLRGRESYKYTWGALDRPAFRRWIWHD